MPNSPRRDGNESGSGSGRKSSRRSADEKIFSIVAFLCCLLLYPVMLYGTAIDSVAELPLWVLTIYDLALVSLGVLSRALSSQKTGALPFYHACSRRSSVRGFLSLLNLVQCVHLHLCARLEMPSLRMLVALFTTVPWWMDRRGGWTIVMSGESSFGKTVNDQPPSTSVTSLLISHVAHLHGLFFGLNLTCALSHFRESHPEQVVALTHFRWYWWWLNLTTNADVLLQPLVDRRRLPGKYLPWATAASVVPATLFALPVLAEHVSEVAATASFLLWYLREHRAFSNFAIALGFTQTFEVVSLLVHRYSLALD